MPSSATTPPPPASRPPARPATPAPHPVTSAAGTARDALRMEEGGKTGPDFGDVLSGFLGKVNTSQHDADHMVESLGLGEPVDVHQVMIALGEASNSLQLTMQV